MTHVSQAAHRVLTGKPTGKTPLTTPRCREEDIKLDMK